MYIVGVSVSSVSVKDYFQILEDTLIGRFVPSFQKKPKRRVILAPKFYYFDIGIDNFLLKRGSIGDITVLPWNQFLKKLWA
jgi:predicted AAA+ superfamily ATPase